jgi:hypothetical protein
MIVKEVDCDFDSMASYHDSALSHLYRLNFPGSVGERTEIEYSLQSYGIYVGQIPLTGSGSVKVQNCYQWIKVRKEIECQNAFRNSVHGIYTGSIVECPGVTDVIVSFIEQRGSACCPKSIRAVCISHLVYSFVVFL